MKLKSAEELVNQYMRELHRPEYAVEAAMLIIKADRQQVREMIQEILRDWHDGKLNTGELLNKIMDMHNKL